VTGERRAGAKTCWTTIELGAELSSRSMSEPIVSPIDGQVAYEFEYLDDAAAMAAVEQAHAAQREWRHTSIAERASLCMKMLDAYEAQLDRHVRELTASRGPRRAARPEPCARASRL
jgi:acyl-CoA reductase-like NAD-dependent aldehyde dehydrogenase